MNKKFKQIEMIIENEYKNIYLAYSQPENAYLRTNKHDTSGFPHYVAILSDNNITLLKKTTEYNKEKEINNVTLNFVSTISLSNPELFNILKKYDDEV